MSGDTYQRVWLSDGGSIWTSPTAPGAAVFGPMTEHKVVPADAIVIERGDDMNVRLIEDEAGRYWKHRDGHDGWDNRGADVMEDHARHLLARAEYLRTHPPVDEAEVERIAQALGAEGLLSESFQEIARCLYLAGVRAPEVTE